MRERRWREGEEKERERNEKASDQGRARMIVGVLRIDRKRGVGHVLRCLYTIVYRHRSTEWPLPYTDSHTLRPHEIKEEKNDVASVEEEEGKEERERKRIQ